MWVDCAHLANTPRLFYCAQSLTHALILDLEKAEEEWGYALKNTIGVLVYGSVSKYLGD